MIEKLMARDELILHKIGLILGGIVGLLLGMFISEKADGYVYDPVEEVEEVVDGTQTA